MNLSIQLSVPSEPTIPHSYQPVYSIDDAFASFMIHSAKFFKDNPHLHIYANRFANSQYGCMLKVLNANANNLKSKSV